MQYSVLMSVYIKDKAEYVTVAIESMLNQTVKPEQYVIVEDGPVTDEVRLLLDCYSSESPELFTRIRLLKNSGLATALNMGLKHCRNELVARMDADDISLPERCEKQIELFVSNPKLKICGTNIDEFYSDVDDVRTSRIVPSEYGDIRKFSRRRQPFNHPTVMYKKSVVLEYGGYSKELRRKEDFDLFSRMLVGGCYAKNVNESLLCYRAGKDNYARRKSFSNLKSAVDVYWRHLRRKGCSFGDFVTITCAEIFFWLMPFELMKKVSDKLLRKRVKESKDD